ncbi:MAG: DUF4160 domain-containing protein [Solirubrobacterales bacterium]
MGCRRSAASSGSRSPCTQRSRPSALPRPPPRGRGQGPDRRPRGDRQHLPRRQLRLVLVWAEVHQDELTENWRRGARR